jgi:hypothetical protein
VIFAAIIVGLLGGCAAGYVVSLRVTTRLAASSSRPRLIRWLAVTGGFLAVLPSGFMAFVVGGNIGGAAGASALSQIGPLGIAIGIAAGLALVLGLGITLCSLAFAALGLIVDKQYLRT